MKKIFNVVFFCIISYLFFYIVKVEYKEVLVYPLTIIYLIVIIVVYKKISNVNKYMFIGLAIFIILAQIVSANVLRIIPYYDLRYVYHEARNFSTLINNIDYFATYTNNIPIMMILKGAFYCASKLNIQDYYAIGAGINIIAIDISILFVILIIKEILGKDKAFFGLILMTLTPVIYEAVPFFYTDTLSMPFVISSIYIYIKMEKQENIKIKIGLTFLLAMVTLIGMNIKPTVAIIYVAIIMYDIFIHKYKSKSEILYPVLSIVSIFILIFLEMICFKVIFSDYIKVIEDKSFTITQHIVMGLHGRGTYDYRDYNYTSSFVGREAKNKADKDRIKTNIDELLAKNELIDFFTRKEAYFWKQADYLLTGTLYSSVENRTLCEKIKKFDKYFLSDYYIIQRITLFVLMLFATFAKRKSEKENIVNYICRITIIGIIMFFAFWEINGRYLTNFIPLFILLQVLGINVITERSIELINKYKIKNEIS